MALSPPSLGRELAAVGEMKEGTTGRQRHGRGGKEPRAVGSWAGSTNSDPGKGRAVHAVSARAVKVVHQNAGGERAGAGVLVALLVLLIPSQEQPADRL